MNPSTFSVSAPAEAEHLRTVHGITQPGVIGVITQQNGILTVEDASGKMRVNMWAFLVWMAAGQPEGLWNGRLTDTMEAQDDRPNQPA
jgi:hypothetical protein